MRQQTARNVVNSNIPGGLSVFFDDMGTFNEPAIRLTVGDDAVEVPLEGDTEDIWVESGGLLQVEAILENRGGTDADNQDGCGLPRESITGVTPDSGTLISFTTQLQTASNTFIERSTLCMGDSGVVGTNPSYSHVTNIDLPPLSGEANATLTTWAQGGSSGVRVTPIYGVGIVIAEGIDGVNIGDPQDDSGGGGGGGDDPTDPGDGGGGGGGGDGFTLDDITLNCSVPTGTATEGDVIEATVDLEAVAPSAYDVDVELYINGDYQKSKTASISTGGAGSVRFFVGLPQTGEYNIAVELSNLRQA